MKRKRSDAKTSRFQSMTREQLVEEIKKLRHREMLLDATEKIAHIGHIEWDYESHRMKSCSEEYARFFNMSVEEVKQSQDSWEKLIEQIHPDDQERYTRAFQGTRKAKSHEIEYRIALKDGTIRHIREISIVVDNKDDERSDAFGILEDITEQKNSEAQLLEAKDTLEITVKKRTEELGNIVEQLKKEIKKREKISSELKFLANHDALTGLPSLRLCKDRLNRSLAHSRRNKQLSAVMFLDLDHFKLVNDSYGHEVGDRVLKSTADRIRAEIRETDTVARMGGDEFLVILSQISEVNDTRRIARNIIQKISQVTYLDQHEIKVGASIGIAIYPEDGTTAEELIKQADNAMYLIKRSGKNNFGFTR